MLCPKCDCKTRVVDCRSFDNGFRRRRKCKSCGYRFTTYETASSLFDKEKMIERIMERLEKVAKSIVQLREKIE